MMRRAALLACVLASCAAPTPKQPAPVTAELPPGLCSAGPDGVMPDGVQSADRGIGGTGVMADRGIGGTGIVGVITGFASVCLAGQEIQYSPDLAVLVDGRPAALSALRVGKVAVIEAAGINPTALSLTLRHEVSGPFERVEPDGAFRIAGQRVLPPPDTTAPVPGAWLLVSGFRREDATVMATRLDPRPPGEVLVRGTLAADGGRLRIGTTEIRPEPGQFRQSGIPVLAIGRLHDGVLLADTVEADTLVSDPARYFGPRVSVLLVEGYAERGFLRFGPAFRIGAPIRDGRALARLERVPGGGFGPAAIREYGPAPAVGPRAGFAPAPLPNRGLDRGLDRGFTPAQGGARSGGQRPGRFDGGPPRGDADGTDRPRFRGPR